MLCTYITKLWSHDMTWLEKHQQAYIFRITDLIHRKDIEEYSRQPINSPKQAFRREKIC